MEKKVLKMYGTPALQVVELEMKSSILVGSGDEPVIPGGGSAPIPPEDVDPGFGD